MGGEVKLVFLQKVMGDRWEFKAEPHVRFDAFLDDLMHVSRFGLRKIRSGSGIYVLGDYYDISDEGMWFLRPHFSNWDEMEATQGRRRYDKDGIHIDFDGSFYEHIFRSTYSGFGKQTTTGTVPPVLPYAVREACTLLGLATNTRPTIEDIRGAFRAKVREAADGHGGYTGDMDKLTKAKEQLLSFVGKG